MASFDPLEILGYGAVTAVGLTAAQCCAAIRAGIKRFSPIEAAVLDDDEAQVGARVSADPRLRADDREWLLNLAARALRECSHGPEHALLWQVPEAHRGHPLSTRDDAELLASLAALLGQPRSDHSQVLRSGAAGLVEALGRAHELIAAGKVERCTIGGADSLLRKPELDRLARDRRLLGPGRSQGLVPGEGAAFVVVGRGPQANSEPRVQVLGLGLGYERNTVIDGARSVGEGFAAAFEAAIELAGVPEAELAFVAGNFNGERYDAWEVSHTHARCYQTRRERLPVLWPAVSTGELGVAGGALALIAATMAIEQGYAVGDAAAVQLRSEGELRGVAIVRGHSSA
jgi:3-oxoacyl-[acyl-carrier-protein] synthase I